MIVPFSLLIYNQSMEANPNPHPVQDDIDPALVAAMESRVIARKVQPYGNRKAGPGRPKGSVKVPGSGKKAGTPNLLTPEFRQWLYDRAKPFELLADICTGREIQDGDTKRKPTVAERMRAAETLARKLLPDLAATTISAPDGGPLTLPYSPLGESFEVARRLAFIFAQAEHQLDDAVSPEVTDAPTVMLCSPLLMPEPQQVGDLYLTCAEQLPGGRELWAIRDADCRFVASAIGRDAAIAKALQSQGQAHEG